MKKNRLKILLLLPLLAVGGCSAWSRHGVFLEPPRKLRVAVLPVECTVKIKKLKAIRSVSGPAADPGLEAEAVKVAVAYITEEISGVLETDLNNSYLFEAVPMERTRLVMKVLGLEGADLSPRQVTELAGALNADVVLKSRLAGYGAIKKKWQLLMLASGLVEGVVQGVVAYKLLDNKGLAIFIAAEEFAQEAAVWVGGVYAFNKIFSPVILECELAGAEDGRTIWSKTAFTTLDRKALKKYPPKERDLKELRLKLTAERAAGEIVKSMQAKALKNLR